MRDGARTNATLPRVMQRSIRGARLDAEVAQRVAAAVGDDAPWVVFERAGAMRIAYGAAAEVRVEGAGARLSIAGQAAASRSSDTSPLTALKELLAEVTADGARAYGYIAFEMAGAIHGVRSQMAAHHTLAHFIVPRLELAETADGVTIRSSDATLMRTANECCGAPATRNGNGAASMYEGIRDESEASDYRALVAAALSAIRQGVIEKAIVSRQVRLPFELDPVQTYLRGVALNTPAGAFILNLPPLAAVGFSPEMLLEVRGRTARTQVLAGTRANGVGAEEDRRARRDLLTDPKEVHEHTMSVRAALEELRAVARSEPVIADFMSVKRRGPVQHLGSEVRATLRRDADAWDALAALFPAVTATGVPKRRATEWIARHEPPRGIYGGVVCMLDGPDHLDAALVLRSAIREHGSWRLQAGAGIVGMSYPAYEYEETCLKLESVARCVMPLSDEVLLADREGLPC